MKYRSFPSFLAVTVSCLISNICVAERYAGSADGSWFRFEVYGGPGSRFEFDLPAKWTAELEVDRSQNVTFTNLKVFSDQRIEFQTHEGNVYADMNIVATYTTDVLDLNPSGPFSPPHQFNIEPFIMDLNVSGTYFNRGFENDFSGHFTTQQFYNRYALSFADFPKSLTMVNSNVTSSYYIGPATLEPGLEISTMTLGGYLDMKLFPLPPDPVEGVIGDSNRDGSFNSGDLVTVFQAGEYEDAILFNSTWETGDWNGDKEFDSGDLVSAFQEGKYEQPEAVAVPEPVSVLMVLGAFMWAARKVTR